MHVPSESESQLRSQISVRFPSRLVTCFLISSPSSMMSIMSSHPWPFSPAMFIERCSLSFLHPSLPSGAIKTISLAFLQAICSQTPASADVTAVLFGPIRPYTILSGRVTGFLSYLWQNEGNTLRLTQQVRMEALVPLAQGSGRASGRGTGPVS